MTKVYLIDEKTLKEDSFINDNVGSEFIQPTIELAQDIHLQELIGTKLMNKICSLVEDDTINTSSDYKLLLDSYVIPYLEWMVTSLIQIPIAYKIRNLGVVQTTDEHTSNTQLKDVQSLEDYYSNKASFYAQRMSKFLHANHNKYPEYCSTDSCADFHSNPNSFRISTYIGK